MDPLFLTLIQLCALTSSTGACLFRDASHCPAKSPLVFGGRIQAQNPDDIIWENGRKVFVLQTPLANTRSHLGSSRRFQLRGSRGVIRIASKSCARSGEGSNVACPVTLPSNLPCRLQGIGSCSSDPLSVSNITSSGFHIEWKHFDPLVRARLAITGYIVQIREIGGPFHQVTRGAKKPSHDFDLLTPGTTYEVQFVPISSSSNDIAPSNIQAVTTLCGGLGKVQNLQVQTLNEDGKLLVTWDSPENTYNCTIFGYGLWVDFIGIASCKNNELIYEDSYIVNTTEKILDGLQSYSNYYVSVKPLINYAEYPAEWHGSKGTTKSVSPTGIVKEVELKENATSDRSLTFAWKKGLDCEEQLGPNFGYKCVLYEIIGGNLEIAGSKRVSEQRCSFSDLKACGSYICKVKPVNDDNEGNFSSPVYGNISAAGLDPVQNLTVSNAGGKRALHVSWSPPGGLCPVHVYNVTYLLLRYKACDDDELSQISPPLQTNQTELTLDLSDDFAEYNISVTPFTESIAGTGLLLEGETVSMTGITQQNGPFVSPRRVTLIDNSPNYIEIGWERVRCSLLGGTFSKFVYSLVQNGVYINGTTEENHVLIDELDAYTPYIFSMSVQTTFGEGPPAEFTGTTPESTPLSYNPEVTVLNMTGVTATTIEVSWYSWNKLIGLGNGTVKSYLLLFGKKGTESDRQENFMDQSSTYQCRNLLPDTDYHFQIQVIGNGKGIGVQGPPSDKQTFRTRCGVPAKPVLTLEPHTVTETSAAFYYRFPEDEDPWKCRNVSVYFEMETDAGEWETVQEMGTDDRIVDKSDLVPCSDNRFRLKVENKHEVTFSNEVDVRTDVASLGKVQNLRVQTLKEDGKLLVTWDPPKNIYNCHIFRYVVLVNFVGIASCNDNENDEAGTHIVNTTEKILEGLQSYSKYYVSVKPFVNYGGNAPELQSLTGTTKAVRPTGIVEEVELKENATSERSLTFAWKKGLDCEEKLGPNFGYICVLFEIIGGNSVPVGSKRVSEKRCSFSDLKACGSYFCKVKPVNDDNEGNFSNPVYGNISAAALGSVRNISIIDLGNGKVLVRWVPPNDSSNICPVKGVILNVTLQRHQACYKCIDREEPPLKSNETSLVMKHLSPFTTYKINIAIDVEGGVSDLEPTDIVLTTKFAAPSSAPRVWPLKIFVTKNALTFKWTLPNCTSLNGIFKQYTIGGNATKEEIGISRKKMRPSYTLYDLTPCTVYSFTVRFVNTFRQGPMGVAHQKTEDDRPGGSFNLMLEPQDNGDLVATWEESSENPCKCDSYIVNIQPLEEKCKERHVSVESDIVLDRNYRNYTFGRSELSLRGSTEYQVSLRAVNTLGESDADAVRKFTNVLPPSGSPMGVILRAIASTSSTLSWRRVSCPHTNGEITGYRYQLTLNGEVVQEETTQLRMVVFNDLTPGTNYTFHVQGGTSAGFGPLTDDFFFETTV